MEEIFNLEIGDSTIKKMLEENPKLPFLSNKEIINKINLLKAIGCSESQVTNIVSGNSLYLSRTNEDIIKLIKYLHKEGFTLNLLLDANPYILNLDPFEIESYIKKEMNNGKNREEILDELESNPSLFLEM